MYNIKDLTANRIEPVTFTELNQLEKDIEEILRTSIDMVCTDEESMLVIGQQVRNQSNGISDLTAIDNNGNIVLVEVKRDREDIVRRKEAFESQAIRYAASYATIESVEDIVQKIYVPYIERYMNEIEIGELTPYEWGLRKLTGFLTENDADKTFNDKQRIILVASDFDEQTLSSVAWLNMNNVDMSCYRLIPYRLDSSVYFQSERLLPVPDYKDYFVGFRDPVRVGETRTASASSSITRTKLPRIKDMLEWGVINEGDRLVSKNQLSRATLLADGRVNVDDVEMSMNNWLRNVYGWDTIQVYAFAIQESSGKTLEELRAEYMLENNIN